MKKIKFFIFSITLLVVAANTFAQQGILITDTISSAQAKAEWVNIYEDSTNTFTLQDISKLTKGNLFGRENLANRNPNYTYWLRFKINANIDQKRNWMIEILDSKFKSVTLYSPNEKGTYDSSNVGTDFDFNKREYNHKNFVFDINLSSKNSNYYYLKFMPDRRGSLLFKISSSQQFVGYSLKEYCLLGFYYGILFIIALYNVILYFTLKEKIYIFYVLYIAAWTWNSLIDDGLGFQYIWSSFPIISKIGFYTSRYILLVLFVLYSRFFLQLKNYAAKLDTLIVWSVGLYLLIDILTQLFNINFIISSIFYLIPFLFIYYASFKIYYKGYLPARFFIISNTLVIVGLTIRMLKIIGILKYITTSEIVSVIAVYGLNIGIFLEIIIFSIAMGDRIRFLKRREEKTQKILINQLRINESLNTKVNRELEEKVTERTVQLKQQAIELENANLKLAQQSEEISRWNQMLDLDNHNLKTKVKEAVEARVKYRDISFEDFLTIFPDELACKRYIEEIKWKNGYECKKCGYKKYCAGNKQFSRRCTKCRYDESITADTILHKCKFSLVKAFYIIAKVNKFEEDLNGSELSLQLELRKSTVWTFKKKILEIKKMSTAQSGEGTSIDYLILNSLK